MLNLRHKTKPAKSACAHLKATPRWDRVEDSGNPEKISRFYCPECDAFVSQAADQPESGATAAGNGRA
jgi:hypothetical protein